VPRAPLLWPSTGDEVRTISGVERLWRTHLINTIDYVSCLKKMHDLAVATYIEVGVGETLAKLARWYRRDMQVLSLGQPGVFERILDAEVE
jgi:malonyl CoA-acyl carrier protein transacylase